MTRVLFVCLGNICRSPLAEAIFNHKILERGLTSAFQADSCATAGYNLGDPPDVRTLANARRNGIVIKHTARLLSRSDLADFDIVLVMDNQNLRNVRTLAAPQQHSKIKLMREFDPMGAGEVPDPYYGDKGDFQEVFEILERSVEGFIGEMTSDSKVN